MTELSPLITALAAATFTWHGARITFVSQFLIAIPLLWVFLDKRGMSHSFERMGIVKHFLLESGQKRIQCLTADREFIGTAWIKFLKISTC